MSSKKDELRPEYPVGLVRSGVRGKYAKRCRDEGTNLVLIDPDLRELFPQRLCRTAQTIGDLTSRSSRPVSPRCSAPQARVESLRLQRAPTVRARRLNAGVIRLINVCAFVQKPKRTARPSAR
jgi:hypothetical protein